MRQTIQQRGYAIDIRPCLVARRFQRGDPIVPGTPEQVWQAIATGPGITAWFTRANVEERVGGAIQFNLGSSGTTSGEVTAWEPPFRFVYVESEWSEDAPPLTTEIIVISRSGGTCLVRMVHALFASTDDWDDQWIDSRNPHDALDPPMMGGFSNGVGTFYSDSQLNGRTVRTRFIWSYITPTSAQWEQAYSFDAGKIWDTNWS